MGFLDKVKDKVDIKSGSATPTQPFPPPPSDQIGENALVRYRKQRGVNLGSWFSLERWMATGVFKDAAKPGQSDLDVAKGSNAKANLEQHWDTWITDQDWQWIVDRGFNTVRIPIGYHHLSSVEPKVLTDTAYAEYGDAFAGAWPRITRAIETAGKYGLGVLIDLHAAAGAQNTDAHSGLSDGKVRFWSTKANLRSTSLALRFLATYLSPIPHVVGLELLNEPAYDDKLWGWYDQTISEIRQVAGSSLPLVISDSWRTDDFAGYVGGKGQGLVLDHHLYRCFTPQDQISGEAHAHKLHNEFVHSFKSQCEKANGSVIVGEFSAALNPGSFPDGMSDGDKDHQKRLLLQAEIQVIEHCCAGWFFWSLKKEEGWDCGWSAKDAATAEILPKWVGGKRLRKDLQGDWGKEDSFRQAYDSHVNYWNQQQGQFEHDRFQAGFMQGWDDAHMFFHHGMELGFVHEWMLRREQAHVAQRGQGPAVWEFGHGFKQGVAKAAEACLE